MLTTDVAELLAPHRFPAGANVSQYVLVAAHLLDCFVDISAVDNLKALYLARKVFGRQLVESPLRAVRDVVANRALYCYPIEMLRALAAVWLFAGLRCNEILRLRVGCVRWQEQDTIIPKTYAAPLLARPARAVTWR